MRIRLRPWQEHAIAAFVALAVTPLAMCEEPVIVGFQLSTFEPYTSLARQVAGDWNRNGCALLVETPQAQTIVATYRFGPTWWGAMTTRLEPVELTVVNASDYDAYDDREKRIALCHEFGHLVKSRAFGWEIGYQHPEDDASCMDVDKRSAHPSEADLWALRQRCLQ